ncbi:hypothetical protein DY000_02017865 [Brassica cretica]|uniref:DUF4283 domain-containing protein n=1 Tax=Brassica cretica TaxID=69181 RepID=A0ABQ7CNY6_BRACR|nr:hypothetical protein DY000_02017865 [Brassica cretica]
MSHSLEPPLVPPLPPDLLFLDPSPQMRDVSPSPKFSSSPVADTAMKDAINLPQAKSSSATEVFSEINNSFKGPEILNPNIGENLKNGEASTSNTPLPSVSFGTVPKVLNSKENSQVPAAPSFSWAERSKKAEKFPKSSLPITLTKEGVPRIKVPNVVFERGANLHSDYIVGIFYGNAPSYGKIWGVLNFLWGKDRRVTIHNLTANAYLFYIPSPSLRQKAGASYIPKKKAGTLVISDGEVALGSNLKDPVDESQARSSDLPSSSHSYVDHLLEANLGSDKALVPAQILESNEIGNQAIQKKSAEDIPFTTVSKAARQRDIIPREKSRVLVTSANPFAALDSDVVSNPDQSSSDDASEDQECLVVTNFIRSNDFYLASSSSSSGSKQQKNKKRKLSKRSPGSGGHPHSHGGTHQN